MNLPSKGTFVVAFSVIFLSLSFFLLWAHYNAGR